MQKHLNLTLILTIVFSLTFSLYLTNPVKVEADSTTTCTSPIGYDAVTRLPCSVVAIPCPASGYYSNGEKCRAVPGNTIANNLTLSSNARAQRGKATYTTTKTIQAILVALGFLDKADGIFGKNTEKAVKEYQRLNGLFVDGKVGKNTIAKLQETIKLLKKTRGEVGEISTEQRIANFIKNAERSVNLADHSTLGVKVLDEPGTKNYERNFGKIPELPELGDVVLFTHLHY